MRCGALKSERTLAVKAAVSQAQALVNQGLMTSHAGGFCHPLPKACLDCPEGLKPFYEGKV
jgi:hypothetical protein